MIRTSLLIPMLAIAVCLLVIGTDSLNVKAQSSSSIGVTPSQISNKLLVPGAIYETKLVVSRAIAANDVVLKVDVFGESINSWISFPNGPSVIVKIGEQRKEMLVRITVPSDVKVGKYVGDLRISMVQEQVGKVNIVPGVRVDVELEITAKEIDAVKIQYVKSLDSVVNMPYQLLIRVNNTGNTLSKPDKLIYSIFDISETKLRTIEYIFTETVEPFQSKDMTILLFDKEQLPLGFYLAKIQIVKNNKEIYSDKLSFRILSFIETPTPTMTVTATPTDENDNITDSSIVKYMILLIFALLLVGIVGILFVFFYEKKKEQQSNSI